MENNTRVFFNRKWINKEVEKPNDFSKEILNNLDGPPQNLLEIGAGNGRDTKLFSEVGLNVDAVEISESGINQLKKLKNVSIISKDMNNVEYGKEKYNYVYAFSSLHYCTKEKRGILLKKLHDSLKKQGRIYIACRSKNDKMYLKSQECKNNFFKFNEIKRQFFSLEELKNEFIKAGFHIKSAKEKTIKYHNKKEEPISKFIEIIGIKTEPDKNRKKLNSRKQCFPLYNNNKKQFNL